MQWLVKQGDILSQPADVLVSDTKAAELKRMLGSKLTA